MKELAISADIVAPLLAWYRASARSLPWREEPTPYHVWLSEAMLQQTRIETVIPYYRRFLEAAPTVEALALLPDDRLMKLWEGLGYYSRARNLKKAAQTLTESYGGALPRTAAELQKLAGIGAYTAGAIASIAFGEPEPAVDGNVLRVVARLCALTSDIADPATKKAVGEALRVLYPRGEDAGSLTQALMELGEHICIPGGAPKCALCPLAARCRANAENLTDRIPYKSPKRARKIEEKTVFLLSCMGKYAVRRRPEKGILAGLWEFPNAEGKLSLSDASDYLRSIGVEIVSAEPCVEATHIFTHVEWHMTGYFILCAAAPEAFVWADAETLRANYAIPSAFRAFCDYMARDGREPANGQELCR